MSNWSGKQIGKYQVKEHLGQGGMGEVYKAFDPTLERDVAIKLIYPHLTNDPEFVERFQREARIVAGLRHPGIVQVHDFSVEDGAYYMVMEFVPGGSLKQQLDALPKGEHMPLDEAMAIFASIVQAVAYAHSQGVVHRDLKPGNVLLPPHGQPVLVDFGLSKIVGGEQVTLSGDVLGTPAYMSPEQCNGEASDARSDVYALGVMLYELTTGTLPFDDDSPVGLILKHISEPPAPPRSINPDLPVEIEDVIQKALAKDPAERFQSAQAMLEALETLPIALVDLSATLPGAEGEIRCPYRGLRAFEEEDAEFFFGREALVAQLVERLAALIPPAGSSPGRGGRFLAILGASGSGKSSLVWAGLLPALRAGGVPGSAKWAVMAMTPGERPLESLAAGLVPILAGEEDQLAATRRLLDNLAADGRALHLAARLAWPQAPPEKRLLLVIDQFEEIFTLCHDEEARGRFIENLLYAAAVGGGRVIVLLTMRADFYHRCAAYRDLAGYLAAQQVLVGPLSEAELRRAVERPAQQVGLRPEPGLTEAILADVAQEPGALPLLQHALLELWERRQGRLLTLRAYQASGGVKGAIAQRAESIYAGFSPQEQALVRRVMLRLTQPGEGTEDTRRRAALAELVPAGGEAAAIARVVQALTDARLLTTGRDERGDEVVDVAHEALIRGWPRLRAWVDEDRAGLRTHRRLTEAAQEWERSGRDESYLYGGARLAEANEWAAKYAGELNVQEREFLDASQELARREAAEHEAQQRREQRQREIAHSRELAALALSHLNDQLELSFLLSAEALRGLDTYQTRRSLLETLWASPHLDQFLHGHSSSVTSVAFSPDGKTLASGSGDKTIILWDVASHRPIGIPLAGHFGAVWSVAFSPDGKTLASGSEDKTVILWDVASRQPIGQPLTGHSSGLSSVAFGPDGQTLASASWDRTIILWDVASRQPIGQPLTEDRGPVLSVAFSPDGQTLASDGNGRTIILWDVVSHQPIGQPLIGHTSYVRSVAFSPNGKILASSSEDGAIVLWDVASRQPIGQPLTGHSGHIWSVAFSPDGKTLASDGGDGTIILWDVASRQPIGQPLTGHSGHVLSLAFSSNSETLASGSSDGTVILWDTTSRQPISIPLAGYFGVVSSVAFSPDGQILASGSTGGNIILWDVASRQPIGQPLTGHSGPVLSVAFGPDGQTLASASWDRTIILWDVASRQPIGQPLTEDRGPVLSVAFSPDGQILASGSWGWTITLWDVVSRQPIGQPLTVYSGPVESVAFSPDGKTLASAGWDKTIVLWDVATHRPIDQPLTGHSETVSGVAFSPDGQTLASGSADGLIILWDVARHQPIGQPLAGHSGPVLSVAFSPDGQILASDGDRGTIILWDVASRQPIGQPLTGRSDYVWSIAFSPDSKTLASDGGDGTIILWDVASRQRWLIGQPSTGHSRSVSGVAFSPDGKTLASGSLDGTIILWDVVGCQPTGIPLTGRPNPVFSVVFSPDGKTLASGHGDRTIILWDIAGRQPIGQPLIGHTDYVTSVAFSPDGKTLASGSEDKTIILWDVASRRPIGQPLTGHSGQVSSVAFSPDGQTLASGSTGGSIILWDVLSRQPIDQPSTGHTSFVHSVAFSPDGKTLASDGGDGTIILWNVANRQRIGQPLAGHTGYVRSVAFSPDGKTLASGCDDKTIILWDVASHQPICQPLIGHTGYVRSVAFSPSGKTLASVSEDKTVILWDVDPQSWLARACGIVGRNFTRQEWDAYFPGEAYRKTCEQWPAGK
jgi:WD40 repeat protein